MFIPVLFIFIDPNTETSIQDPTINPPNSRIQLTPYEIDQLHKAKDILTRDFEDNLSLSRLARLVALNEFKLKKGFKQLFGETVFGYRNSARMEKAMELIRNGERSNEEIAYLIGFEHVSNFHKAFRKHFGFTVNEYRKRQSITFQSIL